MKTKKRKENKFPLSSIEIELYVSIHINTTQKKWNEIEECKQEETKLIKKREEEKVHTQSFTNLI